VVESYGGKTSTSSSPLTSSIDNKIQTLQNNNNIGNNAQVNNAKVDVSGKIEIDVKAPTGVSTEQMKQMFDKEINGIAFQDYMSKFVNSNNSKEPVSKTYTA
jgi:predicted RNA-binding protein with RPS1 domain